MLIQAFAVFLLFACTSAQEASTLEGVSYAICPAVSIPDDNTFLVPGQSTLECVQGCSEDDGCAGVTVCPVITTDQLRCRFMSQACEPSTQEASGSLCKHFQKMGSSTELLCQNGGTPNGDRCHCPIQYGGKLCHRMIRDCSEPFQDGYDGVSNGIYNIKPKDAASAFPVRCAFEWGGVTTVLFREPWADFNKDWTTYKDGFGTDQLASNSYAQYFIGLENLYHFLKQADFHVTVYMYCCGITLGAGNFYVNFTIGPESSSYQIQYDLLEDRSYFGDGFLGSAPMSFSANGHDANGCFSSNSKAGWYDAACTGYGMFSSGPLAWPLKSGVVENIDKMEIQAIRWTPLFYDD